MKRVTFITTGQPTTNPRLVKEVETLIKAGYRVKVIYCFYQSWASPFDEEITGRRPGVYIFCGGSPLSSKLKYYQTRLRQKFCTFISQFTAKAYVIENSVSRTHAEALSIARNIETDIYIAHNLGALPAAVLAAKKSNAKVGYDAEDMHSGFDEPGSNANRMNKYIEEKYFPLTDYFSAASPAIATQYQRLHPYLCPLTINNVFLRNTVPFRPGEQGKKIIRLFWLSQTIGTNRGIENVIKAMHILKDPNLELNLFGNLPEGSFKQLILHQRSLTIHIHPPVAPSAIEEIAGRFDIGLAMETAYCLNNNIALSNKIFSYIQAGLAVIASDTIAQSEFMHNYPSTGRLYPKNDATALAACIKYYLDNPDELRRTRYANYQLGQKSMNWETESRKFTELVNQTLTGY